MNLQKTVQYSGFTLGWFALIVQFVLMMQNRVTDQVETVIRFFSFFTILSNLLVSLSFTALAFNKLHLFKRFKTQTAFVVYISIVALTYNTVLRFIWEPKGIQRIVDELLHVIVPLLYVVNWFLQKNKFAIDYNFIFKILLFPFLYLVVILIRGSFSYYYPYPFLNVSVIGYTQTFYNCTFIMIAFVLISLLFIKLTKTKE